MASEHVRGAPTIKRLSAHCILQTCWLPVGVAGIQIRGKKDGQFPVLVLLRLLVAIAHYPNAVQLLRAIAVSKFDNRSKMDIMLACVFELGCV